MLSALKLDRGPQVTVKYAETFTSEEHYKLLEVDEAILQELLENGLTIKGGQEDEAVLCTMKATYAMKFVSTSNTVLLVPPSEPTQRVDDNAAAKSDFREEKESKSELGVVATASGHIELVEIAPKMEKLKALVSQRPFRDDEIGMDYDDDIEETECSGRLVTWDELSASIQASDSQLKEELKKLGAAEIGKYWRTVDPGYMQNLLEILLNTAVQDDWSLKALREAEVVRRLEGDGFPPQVVVSCLEKFGVQVQPASGEDGSTSHETAHGGQETAVWALDEGKICGQYAKILLSMKPKWKVEEFIEEWGLITPSWTAPHIDMLRGEVLVEKIGMESWLHEFSSSLLPTRPDARFSALFSRRSKWEWEDLEPYLRDLKIPGQSVEAMLLKYTRKSQPTPTSTPIYTAR
ncbi:hypothetical protein R1sor_003026 [Riccia sorocarpa]|uniref:Sister chromatid cohesion protein DCC1 n=1 Tax=Riccia sorocarpa TaxID=122646 RepID=A0ABD3H369_9MARC